MENYLHAIRYLHIDRLVKHSDFDYEINNKQGCR